MWTIEICDLGICQSVRLFVMQLHVGRLCKNASVDLCSVLDEDFLPVGTKETLCRMGDPIPRQRGWRGFSVAFAYYFGHLLYDYFLQRVLLMFFFASLDKVGC